MSSPPYAKPAIVEELCMNAEIGAYQEDDREHDEDGPIVDDDAAGGVERPLR